MPFIFPVFFFWLIICNAFASSLVSESDNHEKSYIRMTVHNVGQGNCITLELNESGEKVWYLVDAGSASFAREMKYKSRLKEKIEEKKAENCQTPPPSRKQTKTPSSEIQILSPLTRKILGKRNKKNDENDSEEYISKESGDQSKEYKNKIKNSIRKSLGSKTENDQGFIKVKTIFVSHPDKDHYTSLREIFTPKDQIENIILGGLPDKYNQTFLKWLQDISRKTHVYFPAIFCEQPIQNIKALISTAEQNYACQMFSDPIKGWDEGAENKKHLKGLADALYFKEKIKVFILTLNPTHQKNEGDKCVRRVCLEDDDNSDSIALKFQINNYSAIISGDGTNITTDRVIWNFPEQTESRGNFLNSTLLVADHHGSTTHGSNNERWVEAVSPMHVIFSSGVMHGHPAIPAYARLRSSKQISRTREHEIMVCGSQRDIDRWINKSKKKQIKKRKNSNSQKNNKKTFCILKSNHSLFSTLSSGDIKITFPEIGDVEIESELHGSFAALSAERQEDLYESEEDIAVSDISESEEGDDSNDEKSDTEEDE